MAVVRFAQSQNIWTFPFLFPNQNENVQAVAGLFCLSSVLVLGFVIHG